MNPLSSSKIKIVFSLFFLIFLACVWLLIRWQIFEHEKFLAIAKERIVNKEVPSIRGDILASDGSALAYSEPRFNIIVYKTELEFAEKYKKQTRREFIDKVSSVLGLDSSELENKINSDGTWITIKKKVKFETKEAVLNLKQDANSQKNLEGIRIEYTSQRIYPEGKLASHVLGFVGKNELGEEKGRAGLESYWEGILKPQQGFEFKEVDSFGNLIALDSVERVEARRGATLKTTIDKNLQEIAEEQIENAVKNYEAKSGTIIIMNPKTGAVLALANFPNFDPNEYFKTENLDAFKNVAITDPAELGSVGKVFTMSAAINEGAIEPDTVVINGHNGCTTVQEKERDWEICTYDKKPQGPLTATEALVKSDNLALFEVAKKIGAEKLHDYLVKFGIGYRTDIDISGESNGILDDVSKWSNVDLATNAYGHGYQMTAIQAITAYIAVANNGRLFSPFVVSEVIESDGSRKEFLPTVISTPISEETSKKMKAMMYEVYKHNLVERRYKDLKKYKIAMKSGTALIPYKDRAGYSNEINATYIGFDASDAQTFIMLVKLEEPHNTFDRLSFYSARVVWLDTFMKIKDYLGVPVVY